MSAVKRRPITAALPRRSRRFRRNLGQLDESLFTAKLATALGDDAALAALTPCDYPNFDRAFLSIVERPLPR